MAARLAALSAAALLCVVAGCGQRPIIDYEPAPTTGTLPGKFYGECGRVSVAEIRDITGLDEVEPLLRNASHCEWSSTGRATYVMFLWYRSSPFERERLGTEFGGHEVRDATIAGRRGYIAYEGHRDCVAAVPDGADFFLWYVLNRDEATAGLCDKAIRLGELTMSRAT